MTSMFRDLDIYGKLLLFISNTSTANKVESADKAGNIIFILIKYISSIHEMLLFMEKDVIGKEEIVGILNEQIELKNNADQIIKEYKAKHKKIYSFIRNKYGFHYGQKQGLEPSICEAVKDCDELEIYLSNTLSGNDVFASTSKIVIATIYDEMKKNRFPDKSSQELLKILVDSASDVGEKLKDFYRKYLFAVVLKSVKFCETGETIEVSAKKFSECQLSFFVVPG